MRTSLGMLVFLSIAPLVAIADVVVPVDSVESYVNIRMEPDANSEVVGRLHQGESMELQQSVPGWHEVSLEGGGSGYVHEDWANVVADAGDDAEPLQADAPGAPVTAEAAIETAPELVAAGEQEVQPDTTESVIAETEASEEAASEEVAEVSVVAEVTEEPDELPAESGESTAVAEEFTPTEEDFVEASDEIEAVADTDSVEPLEEPATDAVASSSGDDELTTIVPVLVGPAGPGGPAGPPGPPGHAAIEGSEDYLMKFTAPTVGGNSQIFDNGRNIGIGTNTPKQRLEVNGNIQIHEQNSNVAGIMLTQSSGETGYIMHNRASTLTIGAGSVDRITIDREGFVGIGMSRPGHPIEMASGAHVSAGGVWTNSSSIDRKENISDVTPEEALRALASLEPVHFNYKQDQLEQHVGFIAEDVPDIVATSDRKGLSTMDIVAILTKVVQTQQAKIEELEDRLNER